MKLVLKFIAVLMAANIFFAAYVYGSELPEEKVVALTFDDGPHYKYTPMLLDVLKKYNAKATFFMIGNRIEYSVDLVRRICDEGHSIGNHTYNHKELTKLNDKDMEREINRANEVIEATTGTTPVLMRPPLGEHNKHVDKIISERGMCLVLWTVDPLDWYHKNPEKTYNKVVSGVKSGDIILMHDFYKSTVEATEKILEKLTVEGYRFVTVDEMLGLGLPAAYGNIRIRPN